MPDLSATFRLRIDQARSLVTCGEATRVAVRTLTTRRGLIDIPKLELLYELAYLRIFSAWEAFLEATFVRYLSGYRGVAAVAFLPGETPSSTLQSAFARMRAGRQYVLWHNPAVVIKRAKDFFAVSPHASVVASHQNRLEHFAAVRHWIAHVSQ